MHRSGRRGGRAVSGAAPAATCASSGFTLLELIIVVAIIGILATIAMPRMLHTPKKAAEATLKTDLRTFRDVLDQYYADKGNYPTSLQELVDDGYLRKIPIDPVTKSADTWVTVLEEPDPDADPAAEQTEPGIIDVNSGAPGNTLGGTPFSDL